MTVFQITGALFLIIEAVCFWLGNWWAMIGCLVLFFIISGVGVATPQFRFFGPFVCRGKIPAGRRVALTFDDGPDPRSTPRLLELLRDRGIRAAFFCIGKQVAAHPELAARIVQEGHLLENHTYSHSNFTNFFTLPRLQREITETQEIIKKSAGTAPAYFRPPMGLSNPRTFRAARNLRMPVVGWSIRSLDTVTRDPKRIVERIRRRLHNGAIVLLHDGNIPVEKLEATVKSLLDTLNQTGYEVVRLDELLK